MTEQNSAKAWIDALLQRRDCPIRIKPFRFFPKVLAFRVRCGKCDTVMVEPAGVGPASLWCKLRRFCRLNYSPLTGAGSAGRVTLYAIDDHAPRLFFHSCSVPIPQQDRCLRAACRQANLFCA